MGHKMGVEYTVSQLRRATEAKEIIWHLQTDGALTAAYQVDKNEFYLSLYKDHLKLIILRIALKNIMKMDILQKSVVVWPNSPADRFLKKFWKTGKIPPKKPEDKLSDDLEAIYEKATASAIEPERSRETLLKLISGF